MYSKSNLEFTMWVACTSHNNALPLSRHIPSPAEAAKGKASGAWRRDVASAERHTPAQAYYILH